MADEQTEGEQGEQTTPEPGERRDRNADRDRRKREQLRAEITELREFKRKTLADQDRNEQDRQRAAGEFEKLEEKLRRQIGDREKTIEELQGQLGTLTGSIRTKAFVDMILDASGVANRQVVEALLPTVVEDAAPEDPSKHDVKSAVDAIKAVAPQLFQSDTPHTKPKPSSGGGRRTPDPTSREYWVSVGQKFSTHQGTSQYDRVVGRSKE